METTRRVVQPRRSWRRPALRIAALPGVQARIDSDFPVKAGLGGSSAAGVAMMGAIEAFRALEAIPSDAPERQALRDAIPLDRAAVAEASRRVEVEELHVAGGFQDHYAAAFGGPLALSFGGGTRVHRLSMQRQTVREPGGALHGGLHRAFSHLGRHDPRRARRLGRA